MKEKQKFYFADIAAGPGKFPFFYTNYLKNI